MNEEPGPLGERLCALRRQAGLSQQELAERAGISVRAISNLERGRTRWPHPDSVQRLADALALEGPARTGFTGVAARRLSPRRPAEAPPPGRGGRPGRFVPRCLPAAVPGFAGRQAELDALSGVLDQPGGTAVVSAIGGMAGIGKTALAVHWAHRVAADFPDGQLFVNLRGFDPHAAPLDPADALAVLLTALQHPADQIPATAQAQAALYRSLLAGKRVLIVLDNASDAAQVRPLLPGSLTCRVVVTSRNQLAGLAATAGARPLTLAALTDDEAVELLTGRLGAGRLAGEAAAVAQIIAACGRLPLALSAVAARAALRPQRPLRLVAADLGGRAPLDALADRQDPAADIRAVFSWSYRQLDPGAARAFRLAGLHPGQDLDGRALAALAGLPAGCAGELLEGMVTLGMIQHADPGRYALHDLLRGYAGELAAGDGETACRAALTGLLDYYLHGAAAAMDEAYPAERHRRPAMAEPGGREPASEGPAFAGPAEAQSWLDAERANLAAAAGLAADRGWPGHAIGLSQILYRDLQGGGRTQYAAAVHTSAFRAAQATGDRKAQAGALASLGSTDLRLGQYRQGAARLREALELHRELADRRSQARVLANLGLAEWLQGDAEQAAQHFRQSLVMHRESGDRVGQTRALANLAMVDMRQGRYERAAGYLADSLELAREMGDRQGEARAHANLGEVELGRGRDAEALRHLQQARSLLSQASGMGAEEADILASLAALELRRGRPARAASYLREALALCRDIGELSRQAIALNGLGDVYLHEGHGVQARAEYAAARRLAAGIGEKYEQARAHLGLARCYRAAGQLPQAREQWRQALARYTELGAAEAEQVRAELAASVPSAAG